MQQIKFILALGLVLVAGASQAQTNQRKTDMTDAEKVALLEATREMVNQFNDRLTKLWTMPSEADRYDMQAFRKNKASLAKEMKHMFYNDGEDWMEWDTIEWYVNGRLEKRLDSALFRERPMIEISSASRDGRVKKNRSAVVNYIDGVCDISTGNKKSNYSQVYVTSSDAVYCKDVRKVDDDKYEVTLSFIQEFKGVNGREHLMYGDLTKKTIKAYIFPIVMYDEVVWKIALGDIKAEETKRVWR